jgi:3-isopropylmalate/(R)-2-methylmalate dehydratase small subunit
MKAVDRVSGRAYPLGLANIDTDMIIPASFLKTITRTGLGKGAFQAIRAQSGNVIDDPRYAGASIIVAGENFGCGSSREHAVWALLDLGIRAVIAPSFAEIFGGNAYKNGLLLVVLPHAQVERLLEVARTSSMTIDLERQVVETSQGDQFKFEIDPFRKHCLVNGLDEIGMTLARESAISEFEQRVAGEQPWL